VDEGRMSVWGWVRFLSLSLLSDFLLSSSVREAVG
jgi:hypothetical protein